MKKAIIIIIGILFISLSIFMIFNGSRYSSKTTGTIINVVENRINKSRKYYPVVKYKANNKVIKKQSTSGTTDSKLYKKGDKWTVYYDKNDINKFTLDKTLKVRSWIIGVLVMVLGIDIVYAGIKFDEKKDSLLDALASLFMGIAHFGY